MFRRLHAKNRQGFTLTELAIVLGIIGSILGAIWVAAGRVNSSNKAQKAAGEYLQIVSNYRSLFVQHGIDVADNTDITCMGITSGFFPDDMIPPNFASCTASASGTTTFSPSPAAATLQNPWNGTVTVSASQTYSGITVTFNGLTSDACANLANAVTGSPDMLMEKIGSVAAIYVPPAGTGTALTTTGIASACAAATGNSVQIMFKAR